MPVFHTDKMKHYFPRLITSLASYSSIQYYIENIHRMNFIFSTVSGYIDIADIMDRLQNQVKSKKSKHKNKYLTLGVNY